METDPRADEYAPLLGIEKDADTIRDAFTDNEPLLMSMRALFLNLNPTQEDKDRVRSAFLNQDLKRIVRNRFMPSLDRSAPIGTLQDVWLGVENMIFGQPKDTIHQAIVYKDLAIDYTKTALALLDDPDGPRVDVSFDAKVYGNDEHGLRLLGRNMFIRHVEKQLGFLKMIAAQKKETAEERKERQTVDSTE